MTATLLYVPLAAEPTADEVKPGWIALLIVLAMAVALALLMRSMVKQFRKVDFEEEPLDSPDEDGSTGSEQTREQNGSTPG